MFQGYRGSGQYADLRLEKVECYCGEVQWVMPNNEREVLSFRCPGCKSTIFQVLDREEDDKHIEYIKEQQI